MNSCLIRDLHNLTGTRFLTPEQSEPSNKGIADGSRPRQRVGAQRRALTGHRWPVILPGRESAGKVNFLTPSHPRRAHPNRPAVSCQGRRMWLLWPKFRFDDRLQQVCGNSGWNGTGHYCNSIDTRSDRLWHLWGVHSF